MKTRNDFPLGNAVTPEELHQDPYGVFARLRTSEPISWISSLNMWFVLDYEDVRTALMDSDRLVTSSANSTIVDTFGLQILTSEGLTHDRYRKATRSPFSPAFIRSRLEGLIEVATEKLIDEFKFSGEVDLRTAFAARLPIQVIARVCGIPCHAERSMRHWYDSFEAALSNFTGDPNVVYAARQAEAELHALLDEAIDSNQGCSNDSLIALLVNAPLHERLANDEIKRNLAIILFGGISTVEALILDAMWALFEHPTALSRVLHDKGTIPQTIEETMRWLSPVQSATRHVVRDFQWQGIHFHSNDIVNCMLGAANRDPSVFTDPDLFDLGRPNSRRHLGFASGSHSCLGSNLAKAEARIAIEALLSTLPNLKVNRRLSTAPEGYEFRQPRKLTITWDNDAF